MQHSQKKVDLFKTALLLRIDLWISHLLCLLICPMLKAQICASHSNGQSTSTLSSCSPNMPESVMNFMLADWDGQIKAPFSCEGTRDCPQYVLSYALVC